MSATSSSVERIGGREHGARIGLVDDVEADARHRQVVGPAQLPDRRGDVRCAAASASASVMSATPMSSTSSTSRIPAVVL